MGLFSRLSNGWSISMKSFKVLKENKQLLIFPILSGSAMVLLIASFVVGAVVSEETIETILNDDQNRALQYLGIFGFYLLNYFIVVFFNVALMHCVKMYFNGEEVDITAGLKFSISRIGAIFAWSVLAATVGTILKVIQEESGIVGKIITGIIGVVWNIATFFVVPVIAYENAGPLQAFKRSAGIMKKQWGESLAGNFSLGLVQLVALLLTALPLYFLGAMVNVVLGVILAVLAGLMVITIISAAQGIFISAVYHRTQGMELSMITEETMSDLFVYRKK